MPWTSERYPVAMKRLNPLVREKAIHIANALLEERHSEGQAIRIAIARAREWARRRALDEDVETEAQAPWGERSARQADCWTSRR